MKQNLSVPITTASFHLVLWTSPLLLVGSLAGVVVSEGCFLWITLKSLRSKDSERTCEHPLSGSGCWLRCSCPSACLVGGKSGSPFSLELLCPEDAHSATPPIPKILRTLWGVVHISSKASWLIMLISRSLLNHAALCCPFHFPSITTTDFSWTPAKCHLKRRIFHLSFFSPIYNTCWFWSPSSALWNRSSPKPYPTLIPGEVLGCHSCFWEGSLCLQQVLWN